MFQCLTHGWTSAKEPCIACHPQPRPLAVRRQLKPIEDPAQFSCRTVRRGRIISASPDTTVYVNGSAVKLPATFGPGDVVAASVVTSGAVVPGVWAVIEEE